MNIGFIGFGKMAQAIALRLLSDANYHIFAASPSQKDGVMKQGLRTCSNNLDVINQAKLIVLAVKPIHMQTVIEEITPALTAEHVLITVASGLDISWYQQHLPPNQSVIRAMPNSAARIGHSATPLFASPSTSVVDKQSAEALFQLIGICRWIDKEQDMDTYTALSGSGPAYVFEFIQSMIEAAVAMGLEPDVAKTFTLETFFGAVTLAMNPEKSLDELTREVTSPGGTTAAAFQVFEQQHLRALIQTAMQAAHARAKELRESCTRPA